MKIVIFSDCYLDLTGGIVTSINAQKSALEKLGHTVIVFSSSYPKTSSEKAKLAKANIFPTPSCKWLFRGVMPVSRRPAIVEKWILKEHPEIRDSDVFYIHYESGCSIAGIRLGQKLSIPTIQVMHGREDKGIEGLIPFGFRTIVASAFNWFHSWYLPHSVKVRRDNFLAKNIADAKMWSLMANHANSADLVLTPSDHFRQKLIHYGVKKKIEVFPNGFPDEKFIKDQPARIYSEGEKLRIIWHSRINRQKRIMEFLQALGRINGPYQLDVYGDGQELNRAKRYTEARNLNVTFHGDVNFSKLPERIAKAHLDVLVSDNSETFGMTLIEAEAYGTPVFFCDPNMQEVVPKGSFVMPKSPSIEDMAESLNDLLSHPERIAKMSKVMLAHREEVLISRRIEKLENIFNDIIKK